MRYKINNKEVLPENVPDHYKKLAQEQSQSAKCYTDFPEWGDTLIINVLPWITDITIIKGVGE